MSCYSLSGNYWWGQSNDLIIFLYQLSERKHYWHNKILVELVLQTVSLDFIALRLRLNHCSVRSSEKDFHHVNIFLTVEMYNGLFSKNIYSLQQLNTLRRQDFFSAVVSGQVFGFFCKRKKIFCWVRLSKIPQPASCKLKRGNLSLLCFALETLKSTQEGEKYILLNETPHHPK